MFKLWSLWPIGLPCLPNPWNDIPLVQGGKNIEFKPVVQAKLIAAIPTYVLFSNTVSVKLNKRAC